MIYLVEDDANIRELVIYTLENTGFESKGFHNGPAFWQAMKIQTPDMIILDIMLPGEDGLSILKKLRNTVSTSRLPVMILTAKDAEYDKILGLDMGADDYLPKPFSIMELIARVKSLLRRAGYDSRIHSDKEEYKIGGLFVSASRHIVTVDDSEAQLTLKEFDLLLYLLKNASIALSREQILTNVWGYDFNGETRTVDVHIRTLRAKLGPCGDIIHTVRGVGYKAGDQR